MEAIIGIAVLCLIVWMLFIRGALFKLILGIFAFIGLRGYLLDNYPSAQSVFMNVMGADVIYATFIPLVIIILAMATTSKNND